MSDLAHADVAESESPAVIALQPDMPFLRASEIGISGDLARLHFGFPIGTPELVLEQLHPVQPVLDVRTFRDDPRSVPLTDGLQMASRRRIERVGSAGAG